MADDYEGIEFSCDRCGASLDQDQEECPKCGGALDGQFSATYRPRRSTLAKVMACGLLIVFVVIPLIVALVFLLY